MAQERYTSYTSDFVHAGGTLVIKMVSGIDLNPGTAVDKITTAGAVDPSAVIQTMADPSVTIRTHDITNVMTTVSATTGLACTSGATIRSVKRADSSTFSTAAGITYTNSSGFLYPESISASQDGPAELTLMYKPFSSSGLADPLTITDAVDISGATAPTFASKLYMGPVYLGSSAVTGILSSSVNFGLVFVPFRGDGDVYAQRGAVHARNPTFSFTTTKENYASTGIGSMFNNAFGSAVKIYYLNGVNGATRTALASTVHTKFTASTGSWRVESRSSSGTGDTIVTISVDLTGTLGMSVASAVP